MKVQSGISLCALAIVTLALVAEATYDLQRLLDLDEDQYYKRGDTDLDPEWGDEWEDLPFKRGVGTQKFIGKLKNKFSILTITKMSSSSNNVPM